MHMKNNKSIHLIIVTILLISLSILSACNGNSNQQRDRETKTFTGTIDIIEDQVAIVTIEEGDILKSGKEVTVDLSVANDTTFQLGDEIRVEYEGAVRESGPLGINTTSVEWIKSTEIPNKDEEAIKPTGKLVEEVELNPFGNQKHLADMAESVVLQYIHWMSHQKVQAEDKWGFFEITDERIDWLLEAIDDRGYTYMEVYKETLNRWSDGDFSEMVQDHNDVWEILGGTKDEQKATGILSESEEQAYIENTEQINEVYGEE